MPDIPFARGVLLYCLSARISYASSFCILLLWFTSPDIISNGCCINPDLGAVVLGILVVYGCDRFACSSNTFNIIVVGLFVGFALLSKLTWVVLLPLVPLLLCAVPILQSSSFPSFKYFSQCLSIVVTALVVLNTFYLMEGTGQPLGKYSFCSKLLGGEDSSIDNLGNRFANSIYSNVPVLVPSNYLLGIDFLRMEVERRYWSFLNGEWRFGSWPYYYLCTVLYKTPEPTLAGAFLGLCVFAYGWFNGLLDVRTKLLFIFFIVPSSVCFISVSLQGGFNHHHRYVLMIYPTLFLLSSYIASPVGSRLLRIPFLFGGRVSVAVPLAISLASLSACSSLSVHPFYTSYFNSISGGPQNGWRKLGFSNIDWGQDILVLEKWLKSNPDRRPLVMDIDYYGLNGELFDVPTCDPPKLPKGASIDVVRKSITETQWWIISVKKLYNLPGLDGLEYLQQIEPVEKIAYCYHVYRIDPLPADESSN